MKSIFASLIFGVFLTSISAFAGEASFFSPVGFNAAKTHYAFVQAGVQDGSGFPFAEAWVVKIQTNQLVARKLVILDTEADPAGTVKKAIDKAIGQISLSTYGITKGKYLGTTLLSHLPTDYSAGPQAIFSPYHYPVGGAGPAALPMYEVQAVSTGFIKAGCEDYPPELLKLSLVGLGETDGRNLVLQNDTDLPTSRGCAHAYKVEQVITSGDALVVIVRYNDRGFEGPNQRLIAVTAKTSL